MIGPDMWTQWKALYAYTICATIEQRTDNFTEIPSLIGCQVSFQIPITSCEAIPREQTL